MEVQEEFISDGKEKEPSLPAASCHPQPSFGRAGVRQGQAELLLLLSDPSQLHLSALTSAFSELSSSQGLHLLLPRLPTLLPSPNNTPKKDPGL